MSAGDVCESCHLRTTAHLIYFDDAAEGYYATVVDLDINGQTMIAMPPEGGGVA